MARCAQLLLLACAMAVAILSAAAEQDGGGDKAGCLSIVGPLQPCLDFLRGEDNRPSNKCCKGAKEVDKAAKTTKDRRQACDCIKDAMNNIKNIDTDRIPQVPKKCNITTSLPPIGPNFNCSTISSGYEGLIGYY